MKRYTYLLSLITIIFISFATFIPEGHAAQDKQRIYDFAEILSEKDILDLEKTAAKYSEENETDFIILTIDDGEADITEYMKDFYDEKGLGYDKEYGNTAIIAINLHKTMRDVQLAGFGKAETYLDDDRLTSIREKITPYLSDGDYKKAFSEFITLSSRYMQFKVGANPANPLYNPWVQIGLALFVGIAIVFLLARNPGMKTTINSRTYQDSNLSKINAKQDRYIRTSVTKRRKPKSNNNSGGGGSSGGGMTRGGRSFSGSRGKF